MFTVDYRYSVLSAVRSAIATNEDGIEDFDKSRDRVEFTSRARTIASPQSQTSKRRREVNNPDAPLRDWRERPPAKGRGRKPRPVTSDRGEKFPSIACAAYAFEIAPFPLRNALELGTVCMGRKWRFVG